MKQSTLAAIFFLLVGVFGVWKLVDLKRQSDARKAASAAAPSSSIAADAGSR